MSRLSDFLKKKFPSAKLDWFLTTTRHLNIRYNKKFLFRIVDARVPRSRNIPLEDCVRSMADIFWNLDVRSVNHGFKKTKISKFQSEPILETPLTREEQVQNLIERFDRFACSDSDED